jgi:tetratricopeptide (TPR) repeat protein
MREQFGRTEHWQEALWCLKAWTLLNEPEPEDAVRQEAIRWVNVVRRPPDKQFDHRRLVWIGAAYYRAGQYELASKALLVSLKESPHANEQWLTGVLLAMTFKQLGRADSASELLAKLKERLDQLRKETPKDQLGEPPLPIDWTTWIVFERWLHEAETLIN